MTEMNILVLVKRLPSSRTNASLPSSSATTAPPAQPPIHALHRGANP
jgi:hypothetical protein